MRAYASIFILTAVWLLDAFGAIAAEPSSPKLWGIAYGPFRDAQSPVGDYPPAPEIAEDMKILGGFTDRVRTYSVDDTQQVIPRLARQNGVACYAGAHVDGDVVANSQETERLIAACAAARCAGLVVGNEVLYHGNLPFDGLIALIRAVKSDARVLRTGTPVGTAAAYETFLTHPRFAELAAEVDFLLINIHPYWAGESVEDAPQYVHARWLDVKAAFPDEEIIIGETGWPSAGDEFGDAVPGEANQQRFLKAFVQLALREDIPYFFFEAFDEKWKEDASGIAVEGNWGLWYSDRTPKPRRFFETPPQLIEIRRVAGCGAGPGRLQKIAGQVHGIGRAERGSYRVVIYAGTNQWYVQPYANDPLTSIRGNLSWSNATHLGYTYAALLVRRDHEPPSTLADLPALDDGVLAVATRECR